jgi:predicted porin
MKKILLGTTALIGATLLAGVASAEDPKVTVGGFSTFEAAYSKSDNNPNEQKPAFRNDNEIHFNIAGKTDAGLGYGAEIDLQADIDGSGASSGAGSANQGLNAHRTYSWLQGDQWGHVEFGSNDGAARTLKVDASNIARATGGIDGDFVRFADTTNPAGGSGTAFGTTGAGRSFITAPRLPVEHGPATTFYSDTWTNDTKITYYTPRFSGFQLGVSYAPDLNNRGQLTNRVDSATATLDAHNIISGGINYEGQFNAGDMGPFGLAVALTGEAGKTDSLATGATPDDLRAWNGGAKLSWLGWSAAGSYGDWKSSFGNNQAYYWTAGLAYETGPIGASVTYMDSRDKPAGENNKFRDVSFGVDYKLAPGLTPFVEYTWYDLDANGNPAAGGLVDNRGGVLIVGSQLSF